MTLESGHAEVHRYGAHSSARSPVELIITIYRELWGSLALAAAFAARDVKAQYRGSFLGIIWAFVPPLFAAIGLTVAAKNNLITFSDTPIPYAAYVLISMSLWQIFTGAVNGPITAISLNKTMLSRVNFVREAVLFAEVLKLSIRIGIQTLLIIFALLYFQIPVGWSVLLAPFAMFVIVLFGTAVGIFLVPIGLLYKDIISALPILTTFWMVFTPVVYPPPPYAGFFATTVRLNPMTHALDTTRTLITAGFPSDWLPFIGVALLSIVMLSLGLMFFRLSMTSVIERWSS